MAIPGNTLRVTADRVPLLSPDDLGRPGKQTDYELGGVDLSNPALGLQYQSWKAWVDGDNIKAAPEPYTAPTLLLNAPGTTEVSLSFDQLMRPMLAYVAGGQAFLWWYDPVLPGQTSLALDADVRSPFLTMDDKREIATQNGDNDVLLLYVRGASLYFRQQRERFTVERLLQTFAGPAISILRAGMNSANRLQVEVQGSDNQPL